MKEPEKRLLTEMRRAGKLPVPRTVGQSVAVLLPDGVLTITLDAIKTVGGIIYAGLVIESDRHDIVRIDRGAPIKTPIVKAITVARSERAGRIERQNHGS